MAEITQYAIKHLPSGWYLPNPIGRGGRGGSHVEPADPRLWPPRMFHTEHAAKVALTTWLKGKVTVTYGRDWDGDVDESWHLEPVPGRVREDMQVVKITMVLP